MQPYHMTAIRKSGCREVHTYTRFYTEKEMNDYADYLEEEGLAVEIKKYVLTPMD